ncbi:MAG: PmoA family protein [Verrucomicrobia bacterium]|nr:PmoA family protein [Verrucomicrobiota bacterium]
MQTMLHRRDFLRLSTAAAALPLAGRLHAATPAAKTAPPPKATNPMTADPAGLTTYQIGPQIWVRFDNRLVTCYRAHRSQKYPYLFPLSGPLSGLSVTSETALPWPHHRSLFFGCDRVNGGNYWQEDFDKGQILSTGPKLGATTPDSVEILDRCEWQKPGGPIVAKEQRRITVTVAGSRLRFIDWETQWQAVETITVQKTNHSLFSARAALDLTPTGGGQLVNAEGDSGEKATFGKKSAWCDFSGKRDAAAGGVIEGIAILDHPKNPWSPCPWFTRDYGFMSPTPMNWIEKPWQLEASQSVTLRYRVVVHAGDAKEAGLAEIFKAWAV